MGILVGRSGDVDRLAALVRATLTAGRAGLGAVTGEPGIGKSALLRAAVAGELPAVRVDTAGYVTEREVPFAAVAPLLRVLGGFGPAGRRLAELSAEGAAPLQVFEAAYRAATTCPLVVVADDLQWFDGRSRALLHYLLRGAVAGPHPLVMLVATRPEPVGLAFRDSLSGLVPPDDRSALTLGPLDVTAGVALARAIDPGLDRRGAERVWTRAGGSPFWLTMLAGGHDDRAWLDARLDALSVDAVDVFGCVVVAARPIGERELAAVLDWPAPRVGAAADRLLAAGLVLRHRGELTVVHDLVREAAHANVPRSRLRSLHQRFAEVLLAADAGPTEMQLALSHRQAAGVGASDVAERLLRSPQRGSFEAATLQLLVAELVTADAPVQRSLAELATDIGEHTVARERWLAASEREPDGGRRAADVLAAARSAYAAGDADGARALLARVRRTEEDVALEVEADLLEVEILRWLEHRPDAASPLTAAALDRTRRHDDGGTAWRRLRFGALAAAADDAMVADDVPRLAGHAEELSTVAAGLGPVHRREAARIAMTAQRSLGRLSEAHATARAVVAEGRDAGLPDLLLAGLKGAAQALYAAGRLPEAAEVISEAVRLEQRVGYRPGERRARAIAALIDLSVVDWRVAVERLAAIEDEEPDPHFRIGVVQGQLLALSAFGESGPDGLRPIAERGRRCLEVAGCRRCGIEFAAAVAEAWARVGAHDRGRSAWRDRPAPGDDPWLDFHAARAQALLRVDRDAAGAGARLRRLADDAERRGWLHDALWTRLELGRVLAATDGDGAVPALTAAMELAERCGARNEQALAEQGLRACGVRTWRRGVGEDGAQEAALSDRELQVAELVASGATNPEIAASLFLSRKTIERHVSSILRKFGVRNRAELAARLRDPSRAG